MFLPDRRIALVTAGVLTALATAACGGGGNDDAERRKPGGAVAVAASDDACDVATTDLPAGTHTFTVTNKGRQVTEFYVYGEGDRVLAEVENIAPASPATSWPSCRPAATRPPASPE